MKRKKVLIACDSYRTLLGFRGKLIKALLLGNDVALFTPQIHHDSVRNKLNDMGVSIYENTLDGSNVSILSDLKYIIQLYEVIKLVKPDIFFPYTFKPVIYGSIVAKFCNVNHIVLMLTGLGYNFLNGDRKKLLVKKITRTLLKLSLKANNRTSLVLQNSDDYRTLVHAGILNKKNKTFIVNGSGVDLSYYNFTIPRTDSLCFLMIARLINAKGIREYFQAAQSILFMYPHVKFQLIGPRDQNIDAIDDTLYKKIKSGQVIDYIGEVEDVRPYINDSSVVVLPSYYGEGIPRCLLEAMAMGRAIITSDSVGCKETVDSSIDHRTGFLVPVRNVEVLIEKMKHFINSHDDIRLFGKNGREYAIDKFDVNKVNRKMLEILGV